MIQDFMYKVLNDLSHVAHSKITHSALAFNQPRPSMQNLEKLHKLANKFGLCGPTKKKTNDIQPFDLY